MTFPTRRWRKATGAGCDEEGGYMPATRISEVRELLDRARRALGPETRRILENAQLGVGGRSRRETNVGTVKALEDYEGLSVQLEPAVYILLAVDQLVDLVEEIGSHA
jgi:hypothetical protein